jgi:hypothetical protein
MRWAVLMLVCWLAAAQTPLHFQVGKTYEAGGVKITIVDSKSTPRTRDTQVPEEWQVHWSSDTQGDEASVDVEYRDASGVIQHEHDWRVRAVQNPVGNVASRSFTVSLGSVTAIKLTLHKTIKLVEFR